MKVQLLYFSGTGNSLNVCQNLKSRLEALSIRVELENIMEKNNIDSCGYDAVGFVFPIHVLGIPRLLGKVINAQNIENNSYIFAIPTFGSDYGIALSQINRLLKKKGLHLHSAFPVQMGANNNLFIKIPGTSTILKLEEQTCVYEKADKTIADIAQKVASRQRNHLPRLSFIGKLRGILAYRWFLSKLNNYHREFKTEECTLCAKCVKSCDLGNISMTEKGPLWHKGCEGCLSCFNTCKNISHGKMDHPRMAERYTVTAGTAIDRQSGNE